MTFLNRTIFKGLFIDHDPRDRIDFRGVLDRRSRCFRSGIVQWGLRVSSS